MGKTRVGFAVAGDPAATTPVRIPQDADEVDALRKTRHFCPTAFGGCGIELIPHAQRQHPDWENYFSHKHETGCSGGGVMTMEHRLIQLKLVEWLAGQGLRAAIETTLPSGARADVAIDRPDGTVETIEVQWSSNQPAHVLKKRNIRYLQDAGKVTWMFAPGLRIAAVGVAQYQDVAPVVSLSRDDTVMLRAVNASGEHSEELPLDSYRYGKTGIEGPGFDEFREAAEESRRQREALRRRQQEAKAIERQRAYPRPKVTEFTGVGIWDEKLRGDAQWHESTRRKLDAWLAATSKARNGVWDGDCSDPVGVIQRPGTQGGLGALVVRKPVRLTRQGVCPMTGRPLFQSRHGAVIRKAGFRSDWVTVRVVGDATRGESLTLPPGSYPLNHEGVTWFGLPEPVGDGVDGIVQIDYESRPPRKDLPLKVRGPLFTAFPPNTFIFKNPRPVASRPTRRSARTDWTLAGSRTLLHAPSMSAMSFGQSVLRVPNTLKLETPSEGGWMFLTAPTRVRLAGDYKMLLATEHVSWAPVPQQYQGRLDLEEVPAPPEAVDEDPTSDLGRMWRTFRSELLESFLLAPPTATPTPTVELPRKAA